MCPIQTSAGIASVNAELDLWREAGQMARVWLRDDDAHEPGDALDGLLARIREHQSSCLFAVVPMRAASPLAHRLGRVPRARVAMHGAWHANHAGEGRKSEETPPQRGIAVIVSEWEIARARLCAHFGPSAGDWYVPPWNRIDREVAVRLPELGFRAISTFSGHELGLSPALVQINTHVDLMDWKGGRVGRSTADVFASLAAELGQARRQGWRPVGVLTHHLVHDAQAWAALDALMALVGTHAAAGWMDPDDLLAGMHAATS